MLARLMSTRSSGLDALLTIPPESETRIRAAVNRAMKSRRRMTPFCALCPQDGQPIPTIKFTTKGLTNRQVLLRVKSEMQRHPHHRHHHHHGTTMSADCYG